jgi:hypothetical protein
MQKTYPVIDLLQKVVDNSFFIKTDKDKTRIVKGDLFGHKNKYFYLNDVIKGILELTEINNSWKIDLDQLHDIMYTKDIKNPTILEQIQKQKTF